MLPASLNHQSSDQCSKCGSPLALLHFQKYCEECKSCPVMLEEDVKIVPRNYRPNSQEIRLNAIAKVEEYIRDIFLRLDIAEPQSTMSRIVQKVIYIHKKRGEKVKGYREQCAAIIFCEFQNYHKMSIAQFCKKNSLVVKKFNKMFLFYKRILKQSTFKHNQQKNNNLSHDIKAEEEKVKLDEEREDNSSNDQIQAKKQEDSFLSEEYLQSNQEVGKKVGKSALFSLMMENIKKVKGTKETGDKIKFQFKDQRVILGIERKNQLNPTTILQDKMKQMKMRSKQAIRQALVKIYDLVFTGLYLQAIKQNIMKTLVDKIHIYDDIWLQENQRVQIKQYVRIPCIIYGVIKASRYKITQQKYIKAVEDGLGVQLSEKKLSCFLKDCKSILIKREGGEELTEINSQTCSVSNNNCLNDASN